jgi:hypothetical protein
MRKIGANFFLGTNVVVRLVAMNRIGGKSKWGLLMPSHKLKSCQKTHRGAMFLVIEKILESHR